MITRFSEIHRKFGFGATARIVLMIIGLIGMSLLGVLVFETWWPLATAVVGLVAGFFLRRKIVDIFEWTAWVLPAAGVVYGVLLFAGERIGISRAGQVIFITLATVIVFGLQFWSLSDPSIVRVEDD